MKLYLTKLQNCGSLSRSEAEACFEQLFGSQVSDEQIAELLISLSAKELVTSELLGFLDYLSENSKPCQLEAEELFDVCGTGGDGKNTINISTLTAFTLAAMGEKVAKHGNYSASSSVGSSNLLEALAVPLADSAERAREIFDKAGIVFLHAPLWHPKLKRVAAVRKSLGIRTVFNLLGPLCNPATPRFQLVGTPSLASARLLAEVLFAKASGTERKFAVIHDNNDYDEISLTAGASIFLNFAQIEISPSDFGQTLIDPESLKLPASMEEAVAVSNRLLAGLGDAAHASVVAANTALALQLRYPERPLKSLHEHAIETIRSGKGMQVLNTLRSLA